MHRKYDMVMMLNTHAQKEQHTVVMMLNTHAQKEQHSYDAEHARGEITI